MARALSALVNVSIATLVIACSAEPVTTSRLDSSGLTVVTHDDVVLVARLASKLAAGAHDFAYIGPVEINRMGHRDYYFWIGLASTVDRDLIGVAAEKNVALALIVDDEPMILPLVEWDTRLDVPPYASSLPIHETLVAPTSLDQIHRIAEAASIEIHLIADAENAVRYQAWHGTWSTWTEFPNER